MGSRNALGEFLRARRELVRPEDVGLRTTGLLLVVYHAAPGTPSAAALDKLAATAVIRYDE
ncbi:hypothetical protein GCM10010435_92830 [Winogradskya consettensis]|uniref:Transcriptional regulator n=1 Tax=Winogradskya consettensis TaxID=113560 RepID=A0A919VM27_9ACTN|nr:hypothetical protein [Actinoplanes consettensis]GIM71229.1 hypothetical protein Aco04nite_24260 [Actinoplanes consettensis]